MNSRITHETKNYKKRKKKKKEKHRTMKKPGGIQKLFFSPASISQMEAQNYLIGNISSKVKNPFQ